MLVGLLLLASWFDDRAARQYRCVIQLAVIVNGTAVDGADFLIAYWLDFCAQELLTQEVNETMLCAITESRLSLCVCDEPLDEASFTVRTKRPRSSEAVRIPWSWDSDRNASL